VGGDRPRRSKLAVGVVVAYPPHGVGRIAVRETRVVRGVEEEEVVVVHFGDDLAVTLPLARAHELLRLPVSEAGLRRVQDTLRADAVLNDEAWSKRMRHAQEMLRRGDPLELAEIVRDGVRREQQLTPRGTPVKLSASERALHMKARESLSSEIGVVRGLDQKEADAWIDEQLALPGG
jgi:RNA polymerase-interacting CarD/CdnL/TRCF family regulator